MNHRQSTAIVVIDMIEHQLNPARGMLPTLREMGLDTDYFVERVNEVVLPATARLLDAARATGTRVVYLRIGTVLEDGSDLVPTVRRIAAWGASATGTDCDVHPLLRPQTGDIDLIKRGSGGFLTSDLDGYLRDLGVRDVYYTGVVTDGCVLLTTTQGFDLGYRGFLVTDATATITAGRQARAEQVLGGFATLVTADRAVAAIESDQAPEPGGGFWRSVDQASPAEPAA